MDPQPRRQLAALIEKEGVGIADDPQRIKAHLLDTCPESRTETELLVAGAQDGLASRLARSSDTIFRDGEITRAVADLRRTRRLDEQASRWVVESWAWALGVLDHEPSDETDEEPIGTEGSPSTDGSAYGAPSSTPPQFVAPDPRHASPYEQTGPAPMPAPQFQQGAGATSAPPYGPGTSAPPYGPGTQVPPMGQQTVPPHWQGGPPPVPSAPPWGPGSSTPPHETSQPSWEQTSPYVASTPPGQQWSQPPPASGAHASGIGGIPPVGPAGPGQSPPGKRRNGLVIGIAAAVIVVVGLVLALLHPWSSGGNNQNQVQPTDPPVTPSSSESAGNTQTQSTTVAPPPASPAEVSLVLTDTLDPSFEQLEIVVVYSNGAEVGRLEVSSASAQASLPVQAPEGPVPYELDVQYLGLDGNEYSCVGQGTINAYDGATFAVKATAVGSGCAASLE